jgi:undecaprenyl-diphosphatase
VVIEILKSIILGIVEGLTEFLPISSTGHLIIVNKWISFSEPFTAMFDVVIQLGAILAVVVYFWGRLWPLDAEFKPEKAALRIWGKTIIGVLPALVFGFLFGKVIEEKLFNPLTVGGAVLVFVEKRRVNSKFETVDAMPLKMAFFIGLIQCLAMIPGTSRAAATIVGAMLLGASRSAATEFSFFLAIPTMVAAAGYSLLKHASALTSSQYAILAVGFLTAFITAHFVIKFFLNYIRRHDFVPFGYYRIGLGIVIFLMLSF